MSDIETQISQKILFVDDEVLLLEGIKRQLRREIDVTIALGPFTALEVLKEQGPFAVVVSDFNMPEMDGIAFLNQVYQLYPQTILVMLTGRAELDIAVNALHNAHISRFLNKPCPKEILMETLVDGMEQYRLRVSETLLKQELATSNQKLNDLNTHLEELVAQKTNALKIQYDYVAQMTIMDDTNAILATFIGTLSLLTGVRDLHLWLNPHQDGEFSCYFPQANQLSSFTSLDCTPGLLTDILHSKQDWYFDGNNRPELSSFDREIIGDQPLLIIPLLNNQTVRGILALAGNKDEPLPDELQQAVASMADVTITALLSHWSREAQEEAQDAIITALAKLSEYRDPETGAHLERLKRYCQLLCRHLGETDKYRNIITPLFSKDLIRSSPLHDIGKVGIVDSILKKPGRLTGDEFEIMKQHASIGGDTLRTVYEKYPSQNFIKCGMDVAYGHHEKWDGSGYPAGLKGEAIPLVARILSLVDVYDALTSQRVYKPAFPREKARDIILEGRATHFDPDIVDAFALLESQFHDIASEFADDIAGTERIEEFGN